MALARLTKQCRECPFVETCEHKEWKHWDIYQNRLWQMSKPRLLLI